METLFDQDVSSGKAYQVSYHRKKTYSSMQVYRFTECEKITIGKLILGNF